MFEFHKAGELSSRDIVRARSDERLQLPAISHASVMLWTEHCTECGAPACYQTCELFQDRGDGHCRRFEYGMFRNSAFSGLHGSGCQIRFKKWGKLDALASTKLVDIEKMPSIESVAQTAARTLDWTGAIAFNVTGDHRLGKLTEAVNARLARLRQRRFQEHIHPDAFLVSVYNPQPYAIRLQVQMYIDHRYPEIGKTAVPFRTECQLRPGYTIHEIPARAFDHLIRSGYPFYISLIPAEEEEVTLVFVAADMVKYAGVGERDKSKTKPVKCVVFDLDNTLWDGTLLENSEVVVEPSKVALLEALDKRGILLSIASKNDERAAMQKLSTFGIADLFVYPQIGWQPKSQSIRAISEQLNIGLDAIAFVDDNAFELDEVRRALPDIATFHAAELATLAARPAFQGSDSEEARNRRRYYQEAIVRDLKLAETGGDYKSFLAECQIKLYVDTYSANDFQRVSELVQRTNQLNFSGRHYSTSELPAIVLDPERRCYVLRSEDRYGSYGLIGFCVTRDRGASIVVEDMMLSCRVQSKGIEGAFFAAVRTSGGAEPARDLEIGFRQTDRNTPARNALKELGCVEEPGRMRLPACVELRCDFIETFWPGTMAVSNSAR